MFDMIPMIYILFLINSFVYAIMQFHIIIFFSDFTLQRRMGGFACFFFVLLYVYNVLFKFDLPMYKFLSSYPYTCINSRGL